MTIERVGKWLTSMYMRGFDCKRAFFVDDNWTHSHLSNEGNRGGRWKNESCGGRKCLRNAEKDEKEMQLHHGVFVFCEIQRFFGHLLYAALHLCLCVCVCKVVELCAL